MQTQSARTKRASTTSNGATEFPFSSVALYADKDEYVVKKLVFDIKKIEFQEKAGFEGTNRWAVTASPKDGRPDEIITLQSNEGRDEQFYAAQAHLVKAGVIRTVRLIRSGKAFYFENAGKEDTP
jgi:hypothetical protein